MHTFKYIAILVSVLLQGCGVLTLNVPTIPEMVGGSPLREVKPMKFVVNNFQDNVLKDPKSNETIVAPYYEIDHRVTIITLNKKGSELFKESIVAELKRSGHEVLEPSNFNNADVVIDGILQKLSLENRPRIMEVDIYSYAEAEITVKTSEQSIVRTYTGFSDCNYPIFNPYIFGAEAWETCIKNSILELTKNFLFDPDFLNFITLVVKSCQVTHTFKT